ncbi:MAG: hypothetical protein MUP66_00140 [Candidatus Nanohaloarchaeota archaeon QJJ-5]|nr:hypothetical protein [Candidatus Nanohaloarchaeota archaeon QJJ-5]
MTQYIFALNGVHTAGKSTFGEMIDERTDLEYHSEIAQMLIDEHDEDWGEEGDHAFQEKIHQYETHRDREIFQHDDDVAIETWHTGNLAHSIENAGDDLVEAQREYLEQVTEQDDTEVYALFFDIPLETIWDRSPHFEEGNEEIIAFYDQVRQNHFDLYDEFDIDYEVIDSTGTPPQTYEQAQPYIESVRE